MVNNNNTKAGAAVNTFTVVDSGEILIATCDDCGTTWACDKWADVVYLQDVGCGCNPEALAAALNPVEITSFASLADIFADAEITVSEI